MVTFKVLIPIQNDDALSFKIFNDIIFHSICDGILAASYILFQLVDKHRMNLKLNRTLLSNYIAIYIIELPL